MTLKQLINTNLNKTPKMSYVIYEEDLGIMPQNLIKYLESAKQVMPSLHIDSQKLTKFSELYYLITEELCIEEVNKQDKLAEIELPSSIILFVSNMSKSSITGKEDIIRGLIKMTSRANNASTVVFYDDVSYYYVYNENIPKPYFSNLTINSYI